MDIRPEVQEACNRLHANDENFTKFQLQCHDSNNNQFGAFTDSLLFVDGLPLNQNETNVLLAALRANTHVKKMMFGIYYHRFWPQKSALMDFIAETLIPSHPSLMQLWLAGDELADDDAERIASALNGNTRLSRFILSHIQLSNNAVQAIAEAVSHNSSLTTFGIANNRLGLDGCRMILSSIPAKPNFNQVKELWLGGNNIGVGGSKVVADFISKAKLLAALGLEDNNLGDEGCQIIASAIPEANSLRTLYLCGNNISDSGCLSFAKALQKNCTLLTIDLDCNIITDNGAASLQASLQHANYSVQRLDLSRNEVSGVQREHIDHICNSNIRFKKTFDHVKSDLPKISLGLWPKVLEAVETKPDLLFTLIKAKPELFRERRAQRKRKFPDLFQC